MPDITEEEKQRISKIKDSIELTFGKINSDIKQCNLAGMARSMIRITDNTRTLKDQNAITSNQYLDIINRMDGMITEVSINCKCRNV